MDNKLMTTIYKITFSFLALITAIQLVISAFYGQIAIDFMLLFYLYLSFNCFRNRFIVIQNLLVPIIICLSMTLIFQIISFAIYLPAPFLSSERDLHQETAKKFFNIISIIALIPTIAILSIQNISKEAMLLKIKFRKPLLGLVIGVFLSIIFSIPLFYLINSKEVNLAYASVKEKYGNEYNYKATQIRREGEKIIIEMMAYNQKEAFSVSITL